MATHTIKLYPSSDISANHTSSSGNSKYSMINDATDDSGSTRIYQTLSASNATVTSTFNCSPNSTDNPPTGKIKVKSIKIETYWTVVASNIDSVTGSLTHGTAFGNSTNYINSSAATKTASSDNYTLKTDTISDSSVINQVFENLNALGAKLRISTSGYYTSSN